MRSPVIAFGLFAAAAVSPSLVSGAPTSPNVGGLATPHVAAADAVPVHAPRVTRETEIPILDDAHKGNRASGHSSGHASSHASSKKHKNKTNSNVKRALDGNTAGGNAFSGTTSDATGGSIDNEGGDNTDNGDEITNTMASESIAAAMIDYY